MAKVYRIEVRLEGIDHEEMAYFSTTSETQTSAVKLFNEVAQSILDDSNSNWGFKKDE